MHTQPSRSGDRDPAEITQLFETYRRTGDRAVRNQLVERHRWLAQMAARRFHHRGEPLDDLEQVALLGVLKAVERFDLDRGVAFSTFAMPTVLGELRRYFRDATWAVHVTRRTKELYLEAGATAESLTQRLGRPPAMTELAAVLGVPVDTVLHALNAGNGYRTAPIVQDSNEDGSSWDSVALAGEDDHLLGASDRVALRQHLRALPERERRILTLRFFEDRTQAEIAEELRLSQVHISRLLRSTLQELRRAYEEPAAARS